MTTRPPFAASGLHVLRPAQPILVGLLSTVLDLCISGETNCRHRQQMVVPVNVAACTGACTHLLEGADSNWAAAR
eukprot:scaffold7522_cov417-Prasinococcus_capsulatus_cf.AAC.5